MADWIVGLRKAAVEPRPRASEGELAQAEQLLGFPLPAELRSLYAQMNGGAFEPDVALYALRQAPDAAGVVEATRSGLIGLPREGVWRFGLRGGGDHLFAARRSALEGLPKEVAPGWLRELPADAWLYGRKNTDTGELELFRSLQALLWHLIPPVESEDFGENTYVKAMNAVQEALDALEESTGDAGPAKRKGKKQAKGTKAKAKSKAGVKGGARRKPAPKGSPKRRPSPKRRR